MANYASNLDEIENDKRKTKREKENLKKKKRKRNANVDSWVISVRPENRFSGYESASNGSEH